MADAPPTKRARMHDLATPTSQDTPCEIAGGQTPGRVDPTTSANAKVRDIHAVIRGVPATLKAAEIKEKLQKRGYAPYTLFHLTKLRSYAFDGGDPAQAR
nr:unnamed protein product [Callosobruchus analis]